MMTKRLVTNGVARTFEYKMWPIKTGGQECRVYRVHGDITNTDELLEAAQELAIELNATSVKFK